MKKSLLIIALFFITCSFSQVYETGISYNLGGVIGEKHQPLKFNISLKNIGFSIKKNINPRIAYRLGVNLINHTDFQIGEVSGGIDFNFSDYNLIRKYNYKTNQTAYLIFELAPLFYSNSKQETEITFSLPAGVGFKKSITKNITASIEAKYRIVFTDNLDAINTNSSTLDSYYFIGTSIYYTFGWPKGYKKQTKF